MAGHVLKRGAGAVQPKLEVSEPGDPLEEEADRVADRIMRMPAPRPGDVAVAGRGSPGVHRLCANCEEERACHFGPHISRMAAAGGTRVEGGGKDVGDPLAGVRTSTAGSPLPEPQRAFFESRFGRSFGHVRVHDDRRSHHLSSAFNARAFTQGSDVFFARGEYSPGSPEGKRLLAHELTHVVQQGAASPGAGQLIQRQCLTGPVCGEPEESEEPAPEETTERVRPVTTPISGSPGSFGEEIAEDLAEERARRRREEPEITHHAYRATFLERYAREQGLPLESIYGIYVDMNIRPESRLGAYRQRCSAFRGFREPFEGDSDDSCLFLRDTHENEAREYLENPESDTVGGRSRENWRLGMNELLTHEFQHAIFAASTRPDNPEGRCSLSTIAYRGTRGTYNVRHFLSELSAILSEFPVRYRARPPHSMEGMDWWVENRVTRSGESIGGALTNLRCVCDCSEVDEYVRQTEEFTTEGWSETERAYLNAALRRRPGLDWPVEPDPAAVAALESLLEAREPGRVHAWSLFTPPSITAGYARFGESDTFLARTGLDFGIPLDRLRRWSARVGIHETVMLSEDYLNFLTGVRAAATWITPGGSGHSFELGLYGELGGAALGESQPPGYRWVPDIYGQGGVTLGYSPPADPSGRLHIGLDIMGGGTFGAGEATPTPWFGVGLRFGLEFFVGSRD